MSSAEEDGIREKYVRHCIECLALTYYFVEKSDSLDKICMRNPLELVEKLRAIAGAGYDAEAVNDVIYRKQNMIGRNPNFLVYFSYFECFTYLDCLPLSVELPEPLRAALNAQYLTKANNYFGEIFAARTYKLLSPALKKDFLTFWYSADSDFRFFELVTVLRPSDNPYFLMASFYQGIDLDKILASLREHGLDNFALLIERAWSPDEERSENLANVHKALSRAYPKTNYLDLERHDLVRFWAAKERELKTVTYLVLGLGLPLSVAVLALGKLREQLDWAKLGE